MSNTAYKSRESNIELLRIVLMTFIVLWHFLVHGMNIIPFQNGESFVNEVNLPYIILCSLICFHVNCFVFISGYFGIGFKTNKVISLYLQILFFSILGFLIGMINGNAYNSRHLLETLLPLSFDKYWFFTDYFFLMLLSPIVNKGLNSISKRQIKIILFLFGFVYICGAGFVFHSQSIRFVLFLFIYTLGRYMRCYPLGFFLCKKAPTLLFLLSISILSIYIYIRYRMGSLLAGNLCNILSYNNPLVIISAVSFFFIFKNTKIPYMKSINWFASGCFSVYLLTDSVDFRFYNKMIIDLFGTNVIFLTCVALSIVLLISAFEKGREFCFAKIYDCIVSSLLSHKHS
ncbi:MAG: acyltransferase [Bacteroidales bacterium]|nr:acyltransferase [Bacteroidales bacterium]